LLSIGPRWVDCTYPVLRRPWSSSLCLSKLNIKIQLLRDSPFGYNLLSHSLAWNDFSLFRFHPTQSQAAYTVGTCSQCCHWKHRPSLQQQPDDFADEIFTHKSLSLENLRFSAIMFFTLFIVTHTNIFCFDLLINFTAYLFYLQNILLPYKIINIIL